MGYVGLSTFVNLTPRPNPNLSGFSTKPAITVHWTGGCSVEGSCFTLELTTLPSAFLFSHDLALRFGHSYASLKKPQPF